MQPVIYSNTELYPSGALDRLVLRFDRWPLKAQLFGYFIPAWIFVSVLCFLLPWVGVLLTGLYLISLFVFTSWSARRAGYWQAKQEIWAAATLAFDLARAGKQPADLEMLVDAMIETLTGHDHAMDYPTGKCFGEEVRRRGFSE